MTVPENINQAQRAHPRVYCASCGQRLASDIPHQAACPFCGASQRRYEIGLHTTVTAQATLERVRTYYRRHPAWLAAQLVIIMVGVVSIIAGNIPSAIVCLILATGLALVALCLPAWRDRVEEHL
jgi:uncharacterized OB-fold protein